IVDRTKIGIDFLPHVAGQKAEPLARLHSGSRQDDAIDFLALEHLDRVSNGDPRLAGAGWPRAEHQSVALQCADVGILCGSSGTNRALAQIDLFESRTGCSGVIVEQRSLGDCLAYGAFNVALAQIAPTLELLVEPFQNSTGLFAGAAGTLDGDI